MPQQDEAIGLRRQVRHEAQSGERSGEGAERFLVAVAVDMRANRHRAAAARRSSRGPGTPTAASPGRERFGLRAGQQGTELVAQSQQAGRLQPDDRQAAGQRRQRAPRLGARRVDQPGGELGAAAAQRAAPGGRDANAQ